MVRDFRRGLSELDRGRAGWLLPASPQLIGELAVEHVTSCTGVKSSWKRPAPPTPENVAAVMELYPVGERFFQEFTLRQVLLNAVENGCGPS